MNNSTAKAKKKKQLRRNQLLKTCAKYGIYDCVCCFKVQAKKSVQTEKHSDMSKKNKILNIITSSIDMPSTSGTCDNNNSISNKNIEFEENCTSTQNVFLNELKTTEVRFINQEEDIDVSLPFDTSTTSALNTSEVSNNIVVMVASNNETISNGNESNVSKYENIEFRHDINFVQIIGSLPMENTIQSPSDTVKVEVQVFENVVAVEKQENCLTLSPNDEEEIDVVNVTIENSLSNLKDIASRAVMAAINTTLEDKNANQNNLTQTLIKEDVQNNNTPVLIQEDNIVGVINTENFSNIEVVNDDEIIIDVESLTDENCLTQIQNKRKRKNVEPIFVNKQLRLTDTVIDLSNSSREDSIIEICDSPNVPKIVTEIITVDDDDTSSIDESTQSNRFDLKCPICLENLHTKEIVSTICGHIFCSLCIKNVIKTTKKCPNCRQRITLKRIHPLFI